MEAPTHIVDSDGEVTIILRNANAPLPDIDDEALLPARMQGSTMSTTPEGTQATAADDNPAAGQDNNRTHEVSSRFTQHVRSQYTPIFGDQDSHQSTGTPARPTGTLVDIDQAPEATRINSEPTAAPILPLPILGAPGPASSQANMHARESSANFPRSLFQPATSPSVGEGVHEDAGHHMPFQQDLDHFSSAAEERNMAEAAEWARTVSGLEDDPAKPGEDNATVTGDGKEIASAEERPSDKVFRIQVSAKHLMLASPVLKTLLTGGWKENVTLLEKGSVEITAESWDLDALLIVLWIIHGKDSLVPRVITLEMFAKIALIVDYYECSEAMGVAADLWMTKLPPFPTFMCGKLVYWMWISWALRLQEIFKETTSIAMSTSDHPIPHLGFPIPDGVIALMNTRRDIAIERLFSLIHETHQELLSRRLGCSFECSAIMHGALTMQIQDTLLSTWPDEPFDGLTYEKLRPEVARIQPPRWYSEAPRVFGEIGRLHKCGDSSFDVLLGDKLGQSVEGLDVLGHCNKR